MEELREYSKMFNPGEFTRSALLHNLRDNDYGCPISEIRDGFWSNPHKPLLPTGAAELRDAIYDAIAKGDIELVSPEGVVYPVHARNDINLAADNIRIRRATCPTCGKPSRECEGHPTCEKCHKPPRRLHLPQDRARTAAASTARSYQEALATHAQHQRHHQP